MPYRLDERTCNLLDSIRFRLSGDELNEIEPEDIHFPVNEDNSTLGTLEAIRERLEGDLFESRGKVTFVQPPNRSRGARVAVAVKRKDGSIYKAEVEFTPSGMTNTKHLSQFKSGDHGNAGLALKIAKKYKKDNPEEFQYGRSRVPGWMR
jgi:hypothetical protein